MHMVYVLWWGVGWGKGTVVGPGCHHNAQNASAWPNWPMRTAYASCGVPCGVLGGLPWVQVATTSHRTRAHEPIGPCARCPCCGGFRGGSREPWVQEGATVTHKTRAH